MAPPPKDEEPEDFAALLAEFEGKSPARRRRDPRVGETVKGTVVSIGQDAVFVDLGAKSEGMVELAELRDESGQLTVKVGDALEGRVVEVGGKAGCVVLRRSGAGVGRGPEARAELEQAREHGLPVEGLVTAVNKGGVEVQVAGVRAFCPISQLDLRHVDDAAPFVGQRLTFKITRYEPGPRGRDPNIVVSRRALLEEAARAQADVTRERLAVGAVLSGKVSSIKDYGAFIDLGGLEGMLHVSELGFQRVSHPRDLLSVGQAVDVQVIKLEKSDDPRRPEKISLSLKSLERDPWQDAAERFPEGARLAGTVARVEPFGAFVEVAPGVEGLVHVSNLASGRNVRHPREVVKPGQAVEVTVLGVDTDKRRLSLALGMAGGAATGEEEADAASVPAAPKSLGTFADLLKKR